MCVVPPPGYQPVEVSKPVATPYVTNKKHIKLLFSGRSLSCITAVPLLSCGSLLLHISIKKLSPVSPIVAKTSLLQR